MRLDLFLVFLCLGIACLVAGLFLTRQAWLPGIEPFHRGSSFFRIALHPERFARPGHLGTIRLLNLAGAALILCAVSVVTYEVLLSILGGR
jgi:hypothetical protein